MRKIVLAFGLLTALGPSCAGSSDTGGEKQPPATRDAPVPVTPDDAPPASDPCGAAALKLGQATPLPLWTPPPECTPQGTGTAIVRNEAELRARLECPAGVVPAIDFTKHALLTHGYTLSPAGAGLNALDDGKLVTLVTIQRNQCPDAPMPMPMNTATWFLLPVDAQRTFGATTCAIESHCK